jgi:dihydrofolate synthase/folylpolyglutamate synthase
LNTLCLAVPEEKHAAGDDLAAWLANIERLHPKNIEMGLDRVKTVMERLEIRFDCPVLTVGGTNGKGSTCTMAQAIWQQAGYRTGLYTSPHIHHFSERLRINGNPVSDEEIVRCFCAVEEARGHIPLTFFEFTTLAILQILARAELDIVILEVGLGGRLDAVNLIPADVAVVTNVDIDHVSYLGDTRELIGYEKAGIFRRGRIAVYGDADPPHSLVHHAADIGADLRVAGRDFHVVHGCDCWDYQGSRLRFDRLPLPALRGKNQVRNACNALMAIDALSAVLPVGESSIQKGLATAYLPGRFQVLGKRPDVILDVAHNPHAASVLASNLRELGACRETHAVFGAMADKDIEGVVAQMRGEVGYWYLTDLPVARAAQTPLLREKLISAGVADSRISLFRDVRAAMAMAKRRARKDDRIVTFGSFWVVAGLTADQTASLAR